MYYALGKSILISVLVIATCTPEKAFAQSAISRSSTSIDSQGGLEPYRITDVATAEIGVVRELHVKRGDEIVSGMPIARLDNDQQAAALKEAEADAEATGTIEAAKREVDFNERRFQITQALVNDGKASPRELERYQLELEIAKSKLRVQEEAKAIAKLRAAKVAIALSDRTILAPHDGVIEEIFHETGEFIAGNAPAIVRLVDLSKMRASFMLSEELAEAFRGKTEAEIRLPNHSVVIGQIEYIASVASPEGRTIAMTVLIDNANRSIRSAHCELVLP